MEEAKPCDAAVLVVNGWEADSAESLKDAVKSQLLMNKTGEIRHLRKSAEGERTTLLVVENGKAVCEAVSSEHVALLQDQLIDTSKLQVAIESTTFTLRGPAVSRLAPGTIMQLCYSVNNDIDICIKEGALTLRGYWEDIGKARDKIYEELLKTKLVDDFQHDEFPSVDTDAHSSLPTPSVYDYVTDLDPKVAELTFQLWKGKSEAVKYDSGQTTVHFTFSTQQELDHAIHSFEQEYKKYEQLEVEYSTVELPPKATADDSHAFIISDVESGVENTHVRWDPQNQQMRIWSTNLPKAKLLLQEKLESLKLTMAQSPLVRTVPKVKELNAKQARAKNLEASVHIQREVQLEFNNGCTITLRLGNMLHERVDAIVNPANPRLVHGGGLAAQIDQASNGQLSFSSREIIAQRGKLNPSDADFTRINAENGFLKCQFVIHAVGPNAHEIKSDERCRMLLKMTVQSVLSIANDLNVTSLAIPAISSGIFGMDKDSVAEVIFSTLVDSMHKCTADDKLSDIRIVIFDEETYYPFQRFAVTFRNSMIQSTEV